MSRMKDHYRQYKLVHGDTEMVCWLKWHKKLTPTSLVRLKEIPDKLWVIREAYEPVLEHPPLSRWQVGGLE